MSRPLPAFKETQLFDWDAEPVLERSSSFFHDEEPGTRRAMRSRRRHGGGGKLLLACALIVGSGVAGLVALIPMVHQHFG